MPGAIVYQGPSLLDPMTNVAAVATWGGVNRKTGPMLQVWILDLSVDPRRTVLTPTKAACGTCPLASGGCYVRWEQAPHTILRKVQGLPARKGVTWTPYPTVRVDQLPQLPVRIGAAGDPAALPTTLVRALALHSTRGWTGYTHQWRSYPGLKPYLMASCEGPGDMAEAEAQGWRAFGTSDVPVPGAVQCPASRTHNAVQCEDCRLCNGQRPGKVRPPVWIAPHGKQSAIVRAIINQKEVLYV